MAIGVEWITRSSGRLLVDVHSEELDVEAMKVRNVRNEIHEVGQLDMLVNFSSSLTRGEYLP